MLLSSFIFVCIIRTIFNVRLASSAPISAVNIAIDVSGDHHVPTASFLGKQTPERNKQETGCA
jgi:hypothetical protein